MYNIVLVEPEIPQNTGNIIRTAAATGCHVHLIKPLGFDISDKALKRAGLDYWHLTDFTVYENLTEFFEKVAGDKFDKNISAWKLDGNKVENNSADDKFDKNTANGKLDGNKVENNSADDKFDKNTANGKLDGNRVENNSADCSLDGNKLDGNKVEDKAPHFYFCSTKAQLRYDEVKYQEGDYLLFGKETRGLPEELLHENYDMTVRIPMVKNARSLNLSNSVAIVVYEAMRQINFENLLEKGHLTKF